MPKSSEILKKRPLETPKIHQKLMSDAGSLVTKDGNNIGKAVQELEMQ